MYFCYQYVKKISIFHIIFFFLASRMYLQLEQNLSALAFLYKVFLTVTIRLVFSQHTSQSFKVNKERTNRDSLSMTNSACHRKCMANLNNKWHGTYSTLHKWFRTNSCQVFHSGSWLNTWNWLSRWTWRHNSSNFNAYCTFVITLKDP